MASKPYIFAVHNAWLNPRQVAVRWASAESLAGAFSDSEI